MKSAVRHSLLLLVVFFCSHVAAEQIGLVISLEGQAIARKADGTTRILELRSPILLHDTLITGANSKIQILLKDETIIYQGADAELTIDEYVYNPAESSENVTSANLVRGVFRVITGNITRLNPDRFRVRTRMATIGIRGCDLGFELQDNLHNILVIALHGYESVEVEATQFQQPQDQHTPGTPERRRVTITRGYRLVSIGPTGELEERDFSPDELTELLNAVMPAGDMDATENDTSEPTDAPDGETDATDDDSTDEDDIHALVDLQDDESDEDTDITEDVSTDEHDTPLILDSTEEEAATTPDPDPVFVEDPHPTLEPIPDPQPQPDPDPDPQPQPDPVFSRKGVGSGWEWGIWEKEGVAESVEFRALDLVSESDFQAIAAGTTLYNLHGEGVAAAIIEHNAQKALVEGLCSLYVQVGQNITPNWDGYFSMDNTRGDALSFDAMGTIQPTGMMTGNRGSHYHMKVNGATFTGSSIVYESITGRLVGPGSGSFPITGAVGSFRFDHGTAQVNGGFGTDLHENGW